MPGFILKKYIFLFIILIASLYPWIYYSFEKGIQIQENPFVENFAESATSVHIGFIPQGNAVQMVKKWQPFIDYLSKELNLPVDMVIKSDYQGVITGLRNSELDIALCGSFVYVQAYSQSNIVPLVKRIIFGSSNYYSVIIVRKDSGFESITDLKGKSFAFTDKNSTTGYLLPTAMMKKTKLENPENFFSEVKFTGNHDSALLAVHNRSVDGASISTTRWNPKNPKIQDLKILWKSEPIPLGPFVARKDLSSENINKIRQAFLKMGKSPDTKDLSKHIEIDGFSPAYDKDYDVVRKIQKSFKGVIPAE